MITKEIKILTLFSALLLAGIFASHFFKKIPQDQRDRFFNFDQGQVFAFQVNHFTTAHFFKKEASGSWLIKQVENQLAREIKQKTGTAAAREDTEFKQADSAEVSKALTYLIELKNLNPVSTEKNKPGLFEINDHSLHVVLFDREQKILDKIYIGKNGPDPLTSFLKRQNSDNIYLADQDFRLLFFRNYNDWLDEK
ncbi:MAG: DUF4340 domain-containing protein [Deltaproteobacteria bacterium]|nr:DUF4340 domain-containing protein [Deltaproteobacteria bacterium]